MFRVPEDTAACLICGGTGAWTGEKDGYEFYRCKVCGFFFVHPVPGDCLAIYDDDYFSGASHGHGYVDYDRDKEPMRPTFFEYIHRIEKTLGRTGTLLDIGAATGYFLDCARTRGWQVAGVEPSGFAAERAREKGIDVRAGTVETVSFEGTLFDVVTMWDVVEHLPEPVETIARVRGLLKPGGLLVINTPDADSFLARALGMKWHLVVPPEHLHLFGRRSIRRLLESAGFVVIEETTIGKKFSIQYVVHTLGRWTSIGFLVRAAESMRGTWFGEFGVRINLRDNMYVACRRGEGESRA